MSGIKNKHIKHLLDADSMRMRGEAKYICQGAVYPTFEKSTTSERSVTCSRCKGIIKRNK